MPEDAVAIVGMAGRFPDAANVEDLWEVMTRPMDAVTRVFDASGGIRRAGGRVNQLDGFDRHLFPISQREADFLDPQQRMLLEACWGALEDASRPPRSTKARVGLFGGVGPSSYFFNHVLPAANPRSDRTFLDETGDLQLLLASDKEYAVGRVAYLLGLTGPVVAVQGACATGLYAVHQAVQALLNGECDIALAGAASASVPQLNRHGATEGMVLAADGKCRAFDAAASGSVFSSGAAVVALRLYEDAVAAGDSVRSVILGSSVGNDGSHKIGLTAPSSRGQAQVITEAINAAGIDVDEVYYIEAHGTGTPVGDPIEIAGLRQVFGNRTDVPVRVGTVKPTLGHLGTAAGIAGLVRTTLMLEKRTLLGIRHLETPNPEIDFGGGNLELQQEDEPWPPRDGLGRVAGVSAFGLGGFNAHVVVAEAPEVDDNNEARPGQHVAGNEWVTLPISAASPGSLARGIEALTQVEVPARLAASTLTAGREILPYRRVVVAHRDETVAKAFAGVTGAVRPSAEAQLTMLFTGHSPRQPWHLARLLVHEPVRDMIREAEPALSDLGWHLDDFELGRAEEDAAARPLGLGQPLQFLAQVGLFRLWRSWGVLPDVILGHSLGEYAAACAADVFDVRTGLRLVAARGHLLQEHRGDGAMAALAVSSDAYQELLGDIAQRGLEPVSVAVRNATDAIVVAGPTESVAAAIRWAEEHGLRARALGFDTAGHSAYVEPLLGRFREMIGEPTLAAPSVHFVSSVTGHREHDSISRVEYWVNQLRAPVEFATAVKSLAEHGTTATLEIGPANVLSAIVANELAGEVALNAQSLAKDRYPEEQLAHAAAALAEHGVNVDLHAVNGPQPRSVRLPLYKFDRTRHWVGDTEVVSSSGTTAIRPLEVVWQAHGPADRVPAREGVWVVVADCDSAVAGGVSEALRSLGHIVVEVPTEPTCKGATLATRVAETIADLALPVSGVLCFVDSRPSAAQSATATWTDHGRPLLEWTLALVRLFSSGEEPPIRSWWFTQGTTDGRTGQVPMSIPAGLLRSLAREDPDLTTYRVVLDPDDSTVDQVTGAMDALTRGDEAELMYRARTRSVRRLIEAELGPETRQDVRADGAYLVIGSGGLGTVTAQHLLTRGAGRVVIASRHAPKTWPRERLANRFGVDAARVSAMTVDITDLAATEALVEQLARGDLPLRGIVHAAVEVRDALVQNITDQDLDAIASVKAKGAAHLLDAVAGQNLDFMTFYSSATATVGNRGQTVYGAASAYVDALVVERAGVATVVQSIAWAPWGDVGHLAERPNVLASLEAIGMGSIDTGQGIEFLDRFLGRRAGVVAALANDWDRWELGASNAEGELYANLRGRAPAARAATSAQADQSTLRQRVDLTGLSDRDARDAICATIVRAARGVLGASLTASSSLQDQGLDSLSAVQLRNEVGAVLEMHVKVDAFLRLDTPAAIAEHIVDLRGAQSR